MKIMYLIDFGFDVPNGSNHLVIKMIDEFLMAGHEVYLVQSHSVGKYSNIPDVLQNREKFVCDIVEKPVISKGNFVKRYLTGIGYEFKAYRKWKKRIKDYDIVIHQSHFTSPFSALLLKRYKRKVIFNIYDIFPGEAYTNGSIKSKFVYNILSWLQKIIYKNSARIFILTEDMKQTLMILGVPFHKINVIPNWFDEKAVHNVAQGSNFFAHEYNLDGTKKYIQYAGTIGVSYDFDLLLDVAKKLAYRTDLVFQVVGEGIFLQHMKNRAKKEKICNIQFIPWQPLEKISDVYSACTLQIVPLRKDVIRNAYPSKILPLMACGRIPVFSVEEDSCFYREINDNKVGIATPLGDTEALADSILYLVDNEDERYRMQENAKKYVYQRYTAKDNINKMIEVFMQMQGGKRK